MSNEIELLLRSVGEHAFSMKYTADCRLRVTVLSKTCESFPAQWEGITEDGHVLYVRFRHHVLQIGIGDTIGAAVDCALSAPIFQKRITMGTDGGSMQYDELKFHTQALIDWP